MMKLPVKPLRNISKGTPKIQDRIEYIRCLLAYPTIKDFAIKLGTRPESMENIILHEQEKHLFTTLRNISEILGVDENWLMVGTGKPYKGDFARFKYVAPPTGGNRVSKEDYGIPDRIKKIRTEKDMSLALFSASIGVGMQKVAKVESRRVKPSVDVINGTILAFGVQDAWLLRGEGKQYKN